MERADIIVIGGGVIGLAIGRALARAGRNIFILEQHDRIASETSSRNSEVIHAGLYYRPGSHKASMSVAGNRQIYDYCRARNVPAKKCGKLIVAANSAEEKALTHLIENARACGIKNLTHLPRAEATKLEPELTCTAACLSPSTGVIDSHAFAAALEADVLDHGGEIVLHTKVTGVETAGDGLSVQTQSDSGIRYALRARWVINAAGLGAGQISAELTPETSTYKPPKIYWGKGHYFDYHAPVPFSHLIYPAPGQASLGIHMTRSIDGMVRFGPDLSWTDTLSYRFDEDDGRRLEQFTTAVQRYWPGLNPEKLSPGTTGIRPKLAGPGQPPADFAIHGPEEHGVAGYIALYGIESPGLTASLPLADAIRARIMNARTQVR